MKANSDGFKVLLLENDPVASNLFKKSLESSPAFPSFVDQAFSIEEALLKLKSYHYHVLLSDYDITSEKSLALLEQIQGFNSGRLPCIFMASSLKDPLKTRETLINAGAADFIFKSENNIQQVVERLLEVYENFQVSRGSKEVFRDRREKRQIAPSLLRGEKEADIPSIQDELTGLYAHSYIYDRIRLEFARAKHEELPLSCLVLDIDHFKAINQAEGYNIGDQLLQQCARILFENCRLGDVVARHAGEEFVILLPNTGHEGAKNLSERLRLIFNEHIFKTNGKIVRFNISIGCFDSSLDLLDNSVDVIEMARQALFASKMSGRNRVTFYEDILPGMQEVLPDIQISEKKIQEFQRKMTEVSNLARKAYLDASRTLIAMLESKDPHTAGHSANCAKYSFLVAQNLGMSDDESEVVQHGALLHDIGKICISDHILLKPGKLTFKEYEAIKQHSYMGYKILKPIRFLQREALVVLHHHEWWNGDGYPCKLKGNEIPIGARIVGVVDTFDTIRAAGGRYKKTTTVQKAVNELVAYAGIQFDPSVVAAFIDVLLIRKELSPEEYDKVKLESAILEAA